MKKYIKDKVFYQGSIVLEGKRIINPTHEQILAAGYVEYIPPIVEVIEPYIPTYSEKVIGLIREIYSIDDELAIIRQKDSKPVEYQSYFDFCEDCKNQVKPS